MAQIADSDRHIVEPRMVWEEYIEPAFRGQMIQIRVSLRGAGFCLRRKTARKSALGAMVSAMLSTDCSFSLNLMVHSICTPAPMKG
jgi:hypothetical protein